MNSLSRLSLHVLPGMILCALLGVSATRAVAQCPQMTHVDTAQALPSGIEVHSGPGILRIVALRNHMLRFTMSDTGQLPSGGSWAVLAKARAARVSAKPFADANSVGFDTSALKVRIARKTMAITVENSDGFVLMQSSHPRRASRRRVPRVPSRAPPMSLRPASVPCRSS